MYFALHYILGTLYVLGNRKVKDLLKLIQVSVFCIDHAQIKPKLGVLSGYKMMSCAVYGCVNNSATNTNLTIQYYYFPKHPTIAQQWITACWRTEPIDVNTAQICSAHFDINSYTSEYKYVDYLGTYCQVLKYDAVPTLYLPNQQTTVTKSEYTQEESCLPNLPIIVYQYDEPNNSDYTSVEVTTEPLEPTTPTEEPQNTENIEKYKLITDSKQLEALKKENLSLEDKIKNLEHLLTSLRSEEEKKDLMLKTRGEEVKQIVDDYDVLKRKTLSIAKQKSILSKVFSEAQIKILSGKKKIYWSNDDMAVAHTIRHLSNTRCYLYLNKNLNIPLPGLSSLKRWATKKSENVREEKSGDLSEFKDDSE